MPVQEYGPSISLTDAKSILALAESTAAANGWAMSVVVVDPGGHPVAMHRMDHAQLASIALAQAKARTAVGFKCNTGAFEEAVGGGHALKLLGVEGLCPVEGGVPLIAGGKVVGAVGVSGAQSSQDGHIAVAVAVAFADAP